MKISLIANQLGALAVKLTDKVSATSSMSDSSRALLKSLHFQGTMSATRLADIAGLTQPSAQRALNRLRQDGLVDWSNTGRTRPARLTERGQDFVAVLIADRDVVLCQALSALSTKEQTEFATLLEKMLAGLTGSSEEARNICRFCDHAICDGPACPVGERARSERTKS